MRLLQRLPSWSLHFTLMVTFVTAVAYQSWQLVSQGDWLLFCLCCVFLSVAIGRVLQIRPQKSNAIEIGTSFYEPAAQPVHEIFCMVISAIGILLEIPLIAGLGAMGFLWIKLLRHIDRKNRWLIVFGSMLFCTPSACELTSLVGLRPWVQAAQSTLLDGFGVFHSQASELYVVYTAERVFDTNATLLFSEWTLLGISCAMIARRLLSFFVAACMLIGSLLPIVLHKLLVTLVAILVWRMQLSPGLWIVVVHTISFGIASIWILNCHCMIARLDTILQSRMNHINLVASDWKSWIANLTVPLVCTIALGWAIRQCPPQEKLNRLYGNQFVMAVESKQLATATKLLPRVVSASGDYSDAIYRFAGSQFPSQPKVGIEIIEAARQRGLLDDRCYLWIANELLPCTDNVASLQPMADRYYQIARKKLAKDSKSTLGLIQYCVAAGRLSEATSQLQVGKFDDPHEKMIAARLLHRLGNSPEAVAQLAVLETTLHDSIQNSQGGELPDPNRIRLLAEVYIIQQKFDQAIRLLDLGRQKLETSEFDEHLIKVLLMHCRSGQLTQHQEIEALERVLAINSQHIGFFEYCAKRLFQTDIPANSHLASLYRNSIAGILKQDHPNPEICRIVGTGLATQGKYELAIRYLTIALDQGGPDDAVLNNLAWVKLQLDPANAGNSLELVNLALQINSNSIESLQTRAEINDVLGNVSEAIADLELANQMGPPNSGIRSKLASLYRKAGALTTAIAYEQSARSLDPLP